jgi:hypothetical protein
MRKLFIFALASRRRVRVVEGARLESVYTSKAYREFESLRLRQIKCDHPNKCWDFSFLVVAEPTPKV